MSLSSVFYVLLVFHPVCVGLPLPEYGVVHQTLDLLKQLKDLVAMKYWSPSVDTDGKQAYHLSRKEDGKSYHSFLQALAEKYVGNFNTFCTVHSELGTVLDKPNLHRLLELYHHSIPAFGHVSLFQELVFETAHQPLKRSVARGNHHTAESFAVEDCLGNDWQTRVGMLYDRLSSDDCNERKAAYIGLRVLLIGRDTVRTEENDRTVMERLVAALHTTIDKCFTAPLLFAIRSNGTVNQGLMGGRMQWTTVCDSKNPRNSSVATPRMVRALERGRRLLHVHGSFGRTVDDYSLSWKAKRSKPSSSVSQTLVSSNEVLTPGTIIQAVIRKRDEESYIVRPHGTGECVLQVFVVIGFVFVVIGFVDSSEDGTWVAAMRCPRVGKDQIQIPKEMVSGNIRLLLLNGAIRRIAVYHLCRYGETYEIDTDSRNVRHSETTVSGGSFRIQTRSQGYPPRLA